MSEVSKTVGQWIVENWGWAVIIFLFFLQGFFKITKIEVNPLGWLIGWIGKHLTADVRKDVADLKGDTVKKFDEIKTDRKKSIDDLKKDYDEKIGALKTDLDFFEKKTDKSIGEMKKGTAQNCNLLKKRLDGVEKSNDMQTVRQIRAHVLDFANSCMNNRRHTKNEFETILKENEDYEALVKKHKLKNAVYKEDFAFIMNCYHDCQKNGTFLNEEHGSES